MPKKNDFKLDVVSVRLVKDAPIYSEHTFNNPADIAAVMGDCVLNSRISLFFIPLPLPVRRERKSGRFLNIGKPDRRGQNLCSFILITG